MYARDFLTQEIQEERTVCRENRFWKLVVDGCLNNLP